MKQSLMFNVSACNLTFELKLTDIMLFTLEVADLEYLATLNTAENRCLVSLQSILPVLRKNHVKISPVNKYVIYASTVVTSKLKSRSLNFPWWLKKLFRHFMTFKKV